MITTDHSENKARRRCSLLRVMAAALAIVNLQHQASAGDSFGGYSAKCTPGVGCSDQPGVSPSDSIYSPTENPIQSESAPFVQSPAATPSVFSGGIEGTLAGQSYAPGYIDWAMPRTLFRLRFDAGFDNNRPDRAEFFYAQCGCNPGGPGPGNPAAGGGAARVNGSVDYQDIRGYLEIASSERFSVFGEVPVRFLQGAGAGQGTLPGGDEAGISDLEAGFKYALSTDPSGFLTFQFKTYIPTGNASQGLGTDHVSLEPGLLFQSQLSENVTLFSELRDWIPVSGSTFDGEDYSGNVLRYGLGLGVTTYENSSIRVTPIVEAVGWSVLDGQVLNTDNLAAGAAAVESARTTIVNGKLGLRTTFKSNNSSLYLGYGHALTGQRWYEDIFRLEYMILL